MPSHRRNLDAVNGQALPPSAVESLAAAAGSVFSLASGIHHEAAATRALLDAARASLAARWQVAPAAITAVNNLGNAFRFAFETLTAKDRVAVSAISRKGALEALTATGARLTELGVDSVGRVSRQVGNQSSTLRCSRQATRKSALSTISSRCFRRSAVRFPLWMPRNGWDGCRGSRPAMSSSSEQAPGPDR